jgi:hypothetical protein
MRFQTPKDREIWQRRLGAGEVGASSPPRSHPSTRQAIDAFRSRTGGSDGGAKGAARAGSLPRSHPSTRQAIDAFRSRTGGSDGGAGPRRERRSQPAPEPLASSETSGPELILEDAATKRATRPQPAPERPGSAAPDDPEIILAGLPEDDGRLRRLLRHGLIFAGLAIVIAVQAGLFIAALRDDGPDLDADVQAALSEGAVQSPDQDVAGRGAEVEPPVVIAPLPPQAAPAPPAPEPASRRAPDAGLLAGAQEPARLPPAPEPPATSGPEPSSATVSKPDAAPTDRLALAAPKPDAARAETRAPAPEVARGGDVAGLPPATDPGQPEMARATAPEPEILPEPDAAQPDRLAQVAPRPDAAPARAEVPPEPEPVLTALPKPDAAPPDPLVEAAPRPDAAPAGSEALPLPKPGPLVEAAPKPDAAPAGSDAPPLPKPVRLAEAASKPDASPGESLQIAPRLDLARPESGGEIASGTDAPPRSPPTMRPPEPDLAALWPEPAAGPASPALDASPAQRLQPAADVPSRPAASTGGDDAGPTTPQPEPGRSEAPLNELAGRALAELTEEAETTALQSAPVPQPTAGPIDLFARAPDPTPPDDAAPGPATLRAPAIRDAATVVDDRQPASSGELSDAADRALAELTGEAGFDGGTAAAPHSPNVPRDLSTALSTPPESSVGSLPSAPAAADARVFVHYTISEPGAGDDARRLARYLQVQGFRVVDVRGVSFPIHTSRIRYFFEEDRREAQTLGGGLSDFFGGGAGERVEIDDFTYFRPKPMPGNLEVWLSGT